MEKNNNLRKIHRVWWILVITMHRNGGLCRELFSKLR